MLGGTYLRPQPYVEMEETTPYTCFRWGPMNRCLSLYKEVCAHPIHKSLSLSVSILQLPVPCCDMSCAPDETCWSGQYSWVLRRWTIFADMIADPSPCKCYRFHGLARPPSGDMLRYGEGME